MSRRRLATLAVVLGSLVGSTIAFGDFTFQPPLSFKPDDKAVTFGNTQASPDASIKWDTTGTDYWRFDTSGAKYVFDGTQAVTSFLFTDNDARPAFVADTTNDEAELWLQTTGSGAAVHVSKGNIDQYSVGVSAGLGRQMILTDYANRTQDHEHAVADDPVLFIHSSTDPDPDETEYGSLSFIAAQDKFEIGSGGKIQIATTGPEVYLGNGVNTADLRVQGGATHNATIGFYKQATLFGAIGHDGDKDQFQMAVSDSAANVIAVVNTGSLGTDCAHAVSTDPKFLVHSDQDCSGAGVNEWISLEHNQTDAVITTAEGQIKLVAAADAGVVMPTEDAATLNAPCAAANVGSIMYFDDGDDSTLAGFCGCVDADDGSNFAWRPLSASAPCP